mmetsp:Transcript_492/g.1391  ORF Transcript_492/g.1391 Transcript_492/m.1391 type:complete len:469 (-) Transcript_492:227-1633(-)
MTVSFLFILSTLLRVQSVVPFQQQPGNRKSQSKCFIHNDYHTLLYSNNNNNKQDETEDDPNDPRVMRRQARSKRYPVINNDKKKSVEKYSKAKTQVQKHRVASKAFDLPEQPVVTTIGGGTATIFAMARSMWGQTTQEGGTTNQQQQQSSNLAPNNYGTNPTPNNIDFSPKWRPPSLRTNVPTMNSQGYASIIWRNVRKRNKPSLWQYALRTYDRMGKRDEEQQKNAAAPVRRSNSHHQGALLAAAKLGSWEKAIEIFELVEREQEKLLQKKTTQPLAGNRKTVRKLPVHVTDDMVVSMLYACVRAMRRMSSTESSLEERRRPLDAARKILETVTVKHGIILESRHYNPLAAAYQKLGLRQEAIALVRSLKDRRIGPEPEDGNQEQFNVYNVGTKDKASYTLLVTGAVLEEDWTGAVDSLRNMTDAGLYPNQRHLNAWTEVSERKTKHRNTRSWKKKRDEVWIERGLR